MILVQRDVISWYDNFHAAIRDRLFHPMNYAVSRFDKAMAAYVDLEKLVAKGKFRSSTMAELEKNAQLV